MQSTLTFFSSDRSSAMLLIKTLTFISGRVAQPTMYMAR